MNRAAGTPCGSRTRVRNASMGTPIVVLSRCSLILNQSEVDLHANIKCIRHLSQEGTSGLHRQESTPSHQVG